MFTLGILGQFGNNGQMTMWKIAPIFTTSIKQEFTYLHTYLKRLFNDMPFTAQALRPMIMSRQL